MEQILATAEKKVLVNMVKLVQKRRIEGENGGWKDFLNVYDKQAGSSLSDPSRRSKDVLVAFLTTLVKKQDLQLLATFLKPTPYVTEESPDETVEQRLVRVTVTHDEYPLCYLFPSDQKDWVVVGSDKKKKKTNKSNRDEMVAIDCEMVLCEDGNEAVVRVAAVDRDLKVILDEFVKPDQEVVDYRTDITGITAKILQNEATLSLVDIQEKLQMFIFEDTILVGQSLNNDMKVLKIDHAKVIDTSLVFKYKYPGAVKPRKLKRPSLNYLCKCILGYEVQKDGVAHNCVDDAEAAMKLVLAIVELGVDTSIPITKDILEVEKSKLYLHRIPHNVSSEEFTKVISTKFTPKLKLCTREGSNYYSAIAVYNSPAEANQAFENIDGDLGKDSTGLPQKQVFLKKSSHSEPRLYFHMRKIVEEDEEIYTTKRSYTEEEEEEENESCKRQKREYDTEEKTEKLLDNDVINEIEELKHKLKEKDEIIDYLKKQLSKKKKICKKKKRHSK
ncbi:unnamed protein product [Cochlearia groenlandica]